MSQPREALSILGFDIGGSKTAIVEGMPSGQILQRQEVSTNADLPFEQVFPNLAAVADGVIANATKANRSVKALSVSVGGPLRIDEGMLLNPPHLPGWHHISLKQRLAERFPRLPVCVEHDGNAGALAEFWFGVGAQRKNLKHLVFLTFGTGLGAGLIVNGQIVHGASDTAGEIGHWRLAKTGPETYGKAGSWEGFASGAGLAKLASSKFPSRWPAPPPIRELVGAMLSDDQEALGVLQESATWLGQGLALIIDAFNPQVIVLGSLAVVLGERVLAPARKVVAQEALPQAVACCEICPSLLGMGIGDVAAIMAALNDPVARKSLGCGAILNQPDPK